MFLQTVSTPSICNLKIHRHQFFTSSLSNFLFDSFKSDGPEIPNEQHLESHKFTQLDKFTAMANVLVHDHQQRVFFNETKRCTRLNMMVKNTSEAFETEQLTAPGGGKTDQPKDQRRRKGTRGSGFFFVALVAAITRSRKWNRSNAAERILNLSKGLGYLYREGNCQKGRSCDSQHPPLCFFAQTRTRHRSDSFPFIRAYEKRIGGESKENSTAVACQKSHRNFDVSCNRGHTEAEKDKALPSAKSMVKFTRGAQTRDVQRAEAKMTPEQACTVRCVELSAVPVSSRALLVCSLGIVL